MDFKQEKPTNSGTKAADIPDKFSSQQIYCESTNILVHLQLMCAQRGKNFGFNWR